MNGFTALKIIALALILSITLSCELKRSNPLDPAGNSSIQAPPRVTGLFATPVNNGVSLTWQQNTSFTDGYYIYRGLAYNAEYARIGIVTSSSITTTTLMLYPGYYYFKVSGYKVYSDTLEGPLSKFTEARVDN